MAIRTYKQNQVKVKIAGFDVDEISEDDEITIEYDRERITKKLDINKGGVYAIREGSPAKITIPILVGSRWMSALNALQKADQQIPLAIADRNGYAGAKLHITSSCMIQDAGVSYGADAPTINYVFDVMHLDEWILP